MDPDVADLISSVSKKIPRDGGFNPVSLLVQRELDLSRVLAWLLSPDADHGSGVSHLLRFLALIGITDVPNPERTRVRLEVPRYAGSSLIGRIDVQIEHPSFLLLIENKPTAGFGHRQLQRYDRSLPRLPGRQEEVVALVGGAWNGGGMRQLEAEAPARILLLGHAVRDWVTFCAADCTDAAVRSFLTSFALHLDDRHGREGSIFMSSIADQMTASPDAVRAAVSIMEARRSLADRMYDNLADHVGRLAADRGMGPVRPIQGEARLFSNDRQGVLRLDVGLDDVDFTLEAEGRDFTDVAITVAFRSKQTNIRAKHAHRILALQETLGKGDEDLNNWYLWWDHLDTLHPSGRLPASKADLWAWAADTTENGLGALFVERAAEARKTLLR